MPKLLPLSLLLLTLGTPAWGAEGDDSGSTPPPATTPAPAPKPLTPAEILKKAWQAGDYATIALYTRPMAKGGDAKAQYTMGRLHFAGQGVKQDYGAAVEWLQLSAAQGYAPAQDYLRALCTRRPQLCQ